MSNALSGNGVVALEEGVIAHLRGGAEASEMIFEKILALHLLYVQVFTMMHNAGRKDLADAYRIWLFARYA